MSYDLLNVTNVTLFTAPVVLAQSGRLGWGVANANGYKTLLLEMSLIDEVVR